MATNYAPLSSSSSTDYASSSTAAPVDDTSRTLVEALQIVAKDNGSMYYQALKQAKTPEQAKRSDIYLSKMAQASELLTRLSKGEDPVLIQKEMDSLGLTPTKLGKIVPTTEGASMAVSSMFGPSIAGVQKVTGEDGKTKYEPVQKSWKRSLIDAASYSKVAGGKIAEATTTGGKIKQSLAMLGDVAAGIPMNIMETAGRVPAYVTGTIASSIDPTTFKEPDFWAPLGDPHSTGLAQYRNPEDHEAAQLFLDFLDPFNIAGAASAGIKLLSMYAKPQVLKAASLIKKGKTLEAIKYLRDLPASDVTRLKELPKKGLTDADLQKLKIQHALNKVESTLNSVSHMGGWDASVRQPIFRPAKPATTSAEYYKSGEASDSFLRSSLRKLARGVSYPFLSDDARAKLPAKIDPADVNVQSMAYEWFAESPTAESAIAGSDKKPAHWKPGREGASKMTVWTADNLIGVTDKSTSWKSQHAYTKARKNAGGKFLDEPGAVSNDALISAFESAVDMSPAGAFKAASQKIARGQASVEPAQVAAARSAELSQMRANESLEQYADRLGLRADERDAILSQKKDAASMQKAIAAFAEEKRRASGLNMVQNAKRNIAINQDLNIPLIEKQASEILDDAVSEGLIGQAERDEYMSIFKDPSAEPSDMAAMIETAVDQIRSTKLGPFDTAEEAAAAETKREKWARKADQKLLQRGRDMERAVTANYAHANTQAAGEAKAAGTDLATIRSNEASRVRDVRITREENAVQRLRDRAQDALDKRVSPSVAGQQASDKTYKDYFSNMAASLEAAIKASMDDPSMGLDAGRANDAHLIAQNLRGITGSGLSLNELDGLATDLRAALTDRRGEIAIPRNEADRILMRLYSAVNKLREDSMRRAADLSHTKNGVLDKKAADKAFEDWKKAKVVRDGLINDRYTLFRHYFPGMSSKIPAHDQVSRSKLLQGIGADYDLALTPNLGGARVSQDYVNILNRVLNDRAARDIPQNFLGKMFDAASRAVATQKMGGGNIEGYVPNIAGEGAPKRLSVYPRENIQTGEGAYTRSDKVYEPTKWNKAIRQASGPMLESLLMGNLDPVSGILYHGYHTFANPRGKAIRPFEGDRNVSGLTSRQQIGTDTYASLMRAVLSSILYGMGSIKKKPGRLMLGRLAVHGAAKANEQVYNDIYQSPQVSDGEALAAIRLMSDEQKRDVLQKAALKLMQGGYLSAARELWDALMVATGQQEYPSNMGKNIPALERTDGFGNPIWNGYRGPMGIAEDAKNKLQELSAPVESHWNSLSNSAKALSEFVSESEGVGKDTSVEGKKAGTISGTIKSTRDRYANTYPEEKMWSLPDADFEELTRQNPAAYHALVADRHMAEPGRWGMDMNELSTTQVPQYLQAAIVRLAGRSGPQDMRKMWSDAIFRGSSMRAALWDKPDVPPELRKIYDDQSLAWSGDGRKPILKVLEYFSTAPNTNELRSAIARDLTLAYAAWAKDNNQESLESLKKFHSFMVGTEDK